MPIETIPQPEVLPVSPALRLRRYDGVCGFALPWYQDAGTVLLVDGDAKRYTPERLERMYAYQDAHGELYWIEVLEGGSWRPVGDVCLSRDDLAIVIGERSCRGRGVGRAAVSALMERARELGWRELLVQDIYRFNEGSRRLFTSLGFRASGATEKGDRYSCSL